jgi:hypothetical protein
MAKRPITRSELQAHLEQQLGFLELSAASFDEGYESEAKRLAVTLRVLLHDTPKSHSLLGQLGKADQAFADTALDFDPTNPVPHSGLVFEALGPPKTRHVALLDDALVCGPTPFHAWWTGRRGHRASQFPAHSASACCFSRNPAVTFGSARSSAALNCASSGTISRIFCRRRNPVNIE